MNLTKEIQFAVGRYLIERGHEHICENFGHHLFEMDVASLSKSDMLHEYEVKISRSDFIADKNKRKKHGISKFELYANPFKCEVKCPNYFYYVCPEGMISKDEIPLFAGLYYYNSENNLDLIKSPQRIHKVPSKRDHIVNKMLRMSSQRKYLGCTMMTHKNNQIKKRNQFINKNNFMENTDIDWKSLGIKFDGKWYSHPQTNTYSDVNLVILELQNPETKKDSAEVQTPQTNEIPCGNCESGTCDVCGKIGILQRTYYHYNIKCECHSPQHFEIVRHCSNCIPKAPKKTIVEIKPILN